MAEHEDRTPIAHTQNRHGRRQPLTEHLQSVSDAAREFAAWFDAAELGYWLGLWHDIGKFNPAFQQYLADAEAQPAHGPRRGPDHKAAGSLLAQRYADSAALVIQAHHGGLKSPSDYKAWLAERKSGQGVDDALSRARAWLPDLEPDHPLALPAHIDDDPLTADVFLRFLSSALIDADRLDTERHVRPEDTERRGALLGLPELWARFERDQRRLMEARGGAEGAQAIRVRETRHAVYAACLAAAEQPPGLYRLTVPTGGGKTRSALGFALRHALLHGLRRVIVAVPYISITEQTASVYRGILASADDAQSVILEHHSAAGSDRDGGREGELLEHSWGELAAENWDAPVVVTTTVQLFESLFATRTSSTRKIHNLARSVIILDEAQTLPPKLLAPILDLLRELCTHYGTTVVLSTATQPAFTAVPLFRSVQAREIVPEPARFFSPLKRVAYDWRTETPLSWEEVAGLIAGEPQALAILNTKADALALLDALDDPDALHLSTLLCGAHRRDVIAQVVGRLERGEPCRLIATQVIEAGVDLDFPLVLRALGPLDSIIQSAGRCNREGRLERGRLIVFRPADGTLPPGSYRTATGVTQALLNRGPLDPDDPATAEGYFQRLLPLIDADPKRIQRLRSRLDFPQVAANFRMIEESESVVVTTYGSDAERAEVRALIEGLRRRQANARTALRRLQPYVVSIRRTDLERYSRAGLVVPVLPGLSEWRGDYHRVRGLTAALAEVLIV